MLLRSVIPGRKTRNKSLLWTVAPHIAEAGILVLVYFAYMYTRKFAFTDSANVAFENAQRVVEFEQSKGLHWEPTWQRLALDATHGIVLFFNWVYIFSFLPILAVSGLILYIRNRERYYFYRNVVLASFAVALFLFMLFPLAPPRMLADKFVDTIAVFGPAFYASREAAQYYNAFAAMPSLHFAWTLIFGIMFIQAGPRWLKVVGVLYPTMTLLAITITGNHYIVDAIGGGVVMIGAFAIPLLLRHLYLRRRRAARRTRRPGSHQEAV